MQNTFDVCSVLLLLNVLNFPFQEGSKDEEQCPTGAQPTYLSEALLNIFFFLLVCMRLSHYHLLGAIKL